MTSWTGRPVSVSWHRTEEVKLDAAPVLPDGPVRDKNGAAGGRPRRDG